MQFEHKTTAGLPQYSLDNPLRAASQDFDQLALDLPCKRTSQRKLESSSWHALAGSGLYVSLIYISFGQLALDLPCKRAPLSANLNLGTQGPSLSEVARFPYAQ